METIALINALVFVVICFICILTGLDLKKWQTWLIGIYGFISGFLIGSLNWGNYSGFQIKPALQLGFLCSFVVISGGAMTRYYRGHFGRETAKDWLLRYGKNKNYSFLARLIQKLLEK